MQVGESISSTFVLRVALNSLFNSHEHSESTSILTSL